MTESRIGACASLVPGTPAYPALLRERLGDGAPTLSACGNLDLARLPLVALLSSIRTPPDLVLRSFDLVRKLRTLEVPVVGGFQSPLEKECLALLLRGRQPVVICPARGIEGMRLRRHWRQPFLDDRLLIVSPFPARQRRPSIRLAEQRNRVVGGLAKRAFLVHARPGSRTFRFARTALDWGIEVFCFEHARNRELLLMGAQPVSGDEVLAWSSR
jgi:predicted Rossmann fold nucleotide-binding protein DprA/Smf involved in DNA uptake